MITRAEIEVFNPNDPTDTYAIISMSDIDYFKRRPSDLWIYLETDDDKLKQYYVSDKPACGAYYLKYVQPFSSYNENNIFGEFEFDYAPFSGY